MLRSQRQHLYEEGSFTDPFHDFLWVLIVILVTALFKFIFIFVVLLFYLTLNTPL